MESNYRLVGEEEEDAEGEEALAPSEEEGEEEQEQLIPAVWESSSPAVLNSS